MSIHNRSSYIIDSTDVNNAKKINSLALDFNSFTIHQRKRRDPKRSFLVNVRRNENLS